MNGRYRKLLAVAAVALAPTAARADVMRVSIPIEQTGPQFFPGVNISWPAFDANLGTLKNEFATFSGLITPGYDWEASHPGEPASVTVTLTPVVGLYTLPRLDLPSETLNVSLGPDPSAGAAEVYAARGTPEPFSLTDDIFNDDGGGGHGDYWAYTDYSPAIFCCGLGTADQTVVSGTLTVQYVYQPAHNNHGHNPNPVPEPATLALLGVGALGIGLVHRRG